MYFLGFLRGPNNGLISIFWPFLRQAANLPITFAVLHLLSLRKKNTNTIQPSSDYISQIKLQNLIKLAVLLKQARLH